MQIRDLIMKSLTKASGVKNPHLEFSSRSQFGDYTTNVALQNKNPNDTAKKILAELEKDKTLKEIVDKIEIAGPGFINFHLSTKALIDNLSQIIEEKENFGREAKIVPEKKIIVEYSSPNIAKPFTIGHLRSTVIGDAIANLLEARGFKVYRDNHLGDWGTQFGKQIYAIKAWGSEYGGIEGIKKSTYPIKILVELYVKFHKEAETNPEIEDKAREWFKKLEDGDKEARNLWQACIDISIIEFNHIYEKLGIKFTENGGKGYGESFFEDRMPDVIAELEKKNLLKVGENGAKLIFFEKDKYPPLMITKSDGATLYATRDLATDKWRKEKYDPDIIINEVGIEQSLYFKQIFEIEKLLGWYKGGQRVHIGHGHFRFKEGKMSTRKGDVIWLEDVLKEALERAKKLGSENNTLAEQVGIGAIKYNDLKRDSKQDIIFDWDEVLNMEGNSGPYLQYTYARCQSVLSKSNSAYKIQNTHLNREENLILRDLTKFPEVIDNAANSYSPNILCEYIYNLAQNYNTFYSKYKILGSENEEFRIVLTFAVGQVLKNGLTLLGIQTPNEM